MRSLARAGLGLALATAAALLAGCATPGSELTVEVELSDGPHSVTLRPETVHCDDDSVGGTRVGTQPVGEFGAVDLDGWAATGTIVTDDAKTEFRSDDLDVDVGDGEVAIGPSPVTVTVTLDPGGSGSFSGEGETAQGTLSGRLLCPGSGG